MDRFYIDKKDGNFMMMCKEPFHNQNLSLKGRGLLATIMAFPPTWEFSIQGLTKILKEGRTSLYSAINELIEQGYCFRSERKSDDGRLLGMDYKFADYPKFAIVEQSNPHSGFLNTENRDTENQTQYNKLSNSINKEIIEDKCSLGTIVPTQLSVEEKREKFKEVCEKYRPQYGDKMVDAFIFYWCEASGNKLRCEIAKQKSGCFEVGRRLATWASKEYNKTDTPKKKKTIWEEMGVTEDYYRNVILK